MQEQNEKIRLSKLMSQRGLCSRREADRFIEQGWVRVNGRIENTLGTRVDPSCTIELLQPAQQVQNKLVTIILNKPVGIVSGQAEDGYEPAINLINAGSHWEDDKAHTRFSGSQLKGLAPAGRLDIDSQGLLVLTQDGRVARRLVGENSDIEKEYLVRYQGDLSAEKLALLNHGLELDGRKLKPATVTELNRDQLRFVLREGRKRQIRRMCEAVGLQVTGLKRVRIGKVKLSRLPEGQWRYLGEREFF
ncbi:MAG: pseudouridine synthase [Acidiferrobacterales bacterium]